MSPTFETEQDRANERAVLQRISQHRPGITFQMTPRHHGFDAWMFVNGQRRGIAEIKNRTHRYGKFSTVYLERRKFQVLTQQAGPLIPYFIVGWTDKIGWLRLDGLYDKMLPLVRAGRRDRGLEEDMDMVYEVPIAYFTTIDREEQREALRLPA